MSNTSVTASYDIRAKANVSMRVVFDRLVSLIWLEIKSDAENRVATGDAFTSSTLFDDCFFDRFEGDGRDPGSFDSCKKVLDSLLATSCFITSYGSFIVQCDSEDTRCFNTEEGEVVACLIGRLFGVEPIRVSFNMDDSRRGSSTASHDIDFNRRTLSREGDGYKFVA